MKKFIKLLIITFSICVTAFSLTSCNREPERERNTNDDTCSFGEVTECN